MEDYKHIFLFLYINYFQPVMKCVGKTREGGKVKRIYDKARTPYRRMLESEHLQESTKEELKRVYESLNPAELKRQITKIQNKLVRAKTRTSKTG